MSKQVEPSEDRLAVRPAEERDPTAARLMLLILVALVVTRCAGLRLSLWTDETHSILNFSADGIRTVFRPEYIPNNHVLFNLLAWATTTVLGRGAIAYRLPSLLPGILAVGVVCWWAWNRLGPWPAVGTALLLIAAPSHAELVPQARGYGLGFFAEALMLVGAASPARRAPSWLHLSSFGAGAMLGMATLPVMLLPFACHATLLVVRREWRVSVVAITSLSGIAMIAWYWPMLPAMVVASGQEFGAVLGVGDVLRLPAQDPFWLIEEPLPPILAALVPVVFWGLLSLGVREARRRGEGVIAAQTVLPVIGTYMGLFLLGFRTVPRFTSFLTLPSAVICSLGMVAMASRVARQLPLRRMAAFIVAVAVLLLAAIHLRRDALPIEAYREAVDQAVRSHARVVTTNAEWGSGFAHYDPGILLPADSAALDRILCDPDRDVAFIEYPLVGRPFDRRCLEGGGAERWEPWPQRLGGAESWMRVWRLRRGTR